MPEYGSVEFDTLFAGTEIPALTTSVTVLSGQGTLSKGAILGKITASGKYKLVDADAEDGSEIASVVLAETINTTGADVVAVVYKTGLFNYDALSVAEGDDVDEHMEELRGVGIHYRTNY